MAEVSIAKFMVDGGNKVKVHILKKVNDENFVGGDETKIVHVKNENGSDKLQEGLTYMFIKPQKLDDDTLAMNPKFKPIKTAKMNVKDKGGVVDQICRRVAEKTPAKGPTGETFGQIETKAANSKITRMTVRCISASKIIASSYGEYRIAKIRDMQNNKGDINLNKHTKNKMEPGKLYHVENFKVSNYKAPDAEHRRLSTLAITVIKEVPEGEKKMYTHIRMGDEEGNGECIGVGKTYGYHGCGSCWKKVEEGSDSCRHCQTPTTTATKEFSAEIYLEIDDDVVTLQGFRRHFPMVMVESVNSEDIETALETELVGKTLKVEFNDADDGNSKKLVKLSVSK